MPTYEYACKSCGHSLEVVQKFSDDALTTCPACNGELRKVFGNVGISFKGSGFYKNDSRSSASSSSSKEAAASTPSADSSSSTPATPSTDSSASKSTPSDKAAS